MSDLIALLVLPIAYFLLKEWAHLEVLKIRFIPIQPTFILIPTIFILMATSQPYKPDWDSIWWSYANGDLNFNKFTLTTQLSESQILEIIEENGLDLKSDTLYGNLFAIVHQNQEANDTLLLENRMEQYYRIDEVVIETDTISNIRFSLEEMSSGKTRINIRSMDVSSDVFEVDFRKKVKKYRPLFKKYLKQNFR